MEIISIIVAVLSLLLSFYVYWKARPSEKQKQEGNAQMRIIASQSIIFWEQLQTLVTSEVKNFKVDSYAFNSLRLNAERLEESIQKAISQGLWDIIVPVNRENSTSMHIAFIQSLTYASSLKSNDQNDWLKDHLLMGVIRLLEVCEKFKGVDDSLRQELVKIRPVEEMRNRAWNYLTESHLRKLE